MNKNHAVFDSQMAKNYEQYLVPFIFEDYAQDIAQRVSVHQPKHVLETAAGTGVVTRHLHQLLNEETMLTVTDLNPDMLDIATSKFESSNRITFEPADALDLPHDNDSFDVVVCQFGIMFFPDKLAGMKETARVLKPKGKFVFSVWDALEKNLHVHTIVTKLMEFFPDNPPDFMNTPFGYHQVDEIRTELQNAGFGKINVSVLPKDSVAPTTQDAVQGMLYSSPLALEIEELMKGSTFDLNAELAKALAKNHGDNPTRAPLQAIAFEAHLV